jgi:mRNA interferase RelE/StbE
VSDNSQFFVKKHPAIKSEDFPNLPSHLVDYFELFEGLLALAPYNPESLLDNEFEHESGIGFDSHDLDSNRELANHRALDIIYLKQHYRVVYRIDERPDITRVDIYSFDRHNPAYDKAVNRSLGRR